MRNIIIWGLFVVYLGVGAKDQVYRSEESEVGLLLPLCSSRDGTQVVRLSNKHCYQGAISLALNLSVLHPSQKLHRIMLCFLGNHKQVSEDL